MNYRRYPQLTDRLAAEYVLGTLRHGARRRFEYWMEEEPMVKRQVEFWQNKLHPLLHAVRPVDPPARVWAGIEQRLFTRRQADAPAPWWNSVRLWRWMGGAATACSLLLAVWLVRLIQAPHPEPVYIAVLGDTQQQAPIVVRYDTEHRQLQLARLQAASLPSRKDLELWLIPADNGAPISLGVVPNQALATVELGAEQQAQLQRSKALAISLEPQGGSPTGAPTGPVLWSGAIAGKV